MLYLMYVIYSQHPETKGTGAMFNKNLAKKAAAVFLSGIMTMSALPVLTHAQMNYSEFEAGYSYPTEMRGLTAYQIVNDMGAGWNLGNSLESSGSETNWGNPMTTKDMIDDIAEKGFTTLRVPVRWDDHYSDSSNYTIDTSFMDRVETVVNYGLANDMYVILNVHHNDLQEKAGDTQAVSAELSAVWTQVGERFKNYGDKLIFEVNNEPRSGNDWNGTAALYESVNVANEAARSAIRATGGNNTERLVMLPTYCASCDDPKAAAWTKNENDDMIAVSVHAYLPWNFAYECEHSEWLDSDRIELQSFFDRVYNHFVSKGVPVVIGEFGAANNNNEDARAVYAGVYAELARQYPAQDIPCVIWDNNGYNVGQENFGLYNRSSKTFTYGKIADALVAGYAGDPVAESASTSEILLFEGSSSCTGWEQALKTSADPIKQMIPTQSVYAYYTSAAPELILQSYSNSSKDWIKIAPDSASNGVAVWSYSTLLSTYKDNFNDADELYIGSTGSALTLTKLLIKDNNAHTHVYNGSTEIVIESTATTHGRSIVNCSVNGCDAYSIKVTDLLEEKPVLIPELSVTAGNACVNATWNVIDGATKYAVYLYDNGVYTCKSSNVTGTSYTFTGLKGGTKYGFKVKAYVNGAWQEASAMVYATPLSPVIPENIKTTAGDSKVTMTWDAVAGATKYAVYMLQNGAYVCKSNAVTGTSYTFTGLTNGTKYSFMVKAYVNGAWKVASGAVSGTPVASVIPDNIKTTAGDSKVTMTWDKVTGATKYAVYMLENGAYVCKSNAVTGTSYTFTGLTNGTKYSFRVKAYVNGAWKTASGTVYGTPVASVIPENIKTTAGDSKVTMTWDAVTGATKYAVYMLENGAYVCKSNAVTGTSYTFTGLTNGTKYSFRVKAYVNGAWKTASATVYGTPVASVIPQNIKTTAGDSKVTMTWDKVTGATKYAVYMLQNGAYVCKSNAVTGTSYTFTGLTNGTKYSFRVKAYVNGAWKTASATVYGTPEA